MVFFIIVLAVMLPILLGTALAFGVTRFDNVVTETKEILEEMDRQYNPSMTMGHQVKMNADVDEQIQEARRLAAKKAAAMPRGANMRIGRKGHENLQTAFREVGEDPLTAVKIAAYHGWDGVRTGIPAAGAAQQQTAAAGAAQSGKVVIKPGRDYQVVDITDDMSGEERRQARIANAKAKAKAYKDAKAAGATPVAPGSAAAQEATQGAPAQPQQPPRPQQAQATPAAAAGVPEPNYIEITDDMSADEVRKARINNAKEKSKYKKALKAAGIDPSAVEVDGNGAGAQQQTTTAEAQSQQEQQPPQPQQQDAAQAAAAAGIPEPDYIEITDDMSADEVRKARINNAKEKSKYKKALKAAGIDLKTVA